MINKKAGFTVYEITLQRGEKSWQRHQQHNHLLQIKKCPGGRFLGFGVSGFGSGVFFFWFLKTQQLILLGIPGSSQLCWPPPAFPFFGPGLDISTPNAFPSHKLCSSLYLVQKNHSLLGSTTHTTQYSLFSEGAGKHRASINVLFVSVLGK